MSIGRKNDKVYNDPAAFEALTNIERQAKMTAYKPLVFICSPFAGDVTRNVRKAQWYCRLAVSRNAIPFAPHLLFPQFMDDDDKESREYGIFMGLVLMGKCQELWCFGDYISKGMAIELEKAKARNMVIRYFNDHGEEV